MSPTPYFHFNGTAREALTFYASVFGCSVGAAEPSTLREWFAKLSEGGRVVDDLRARPWGASDGQVIDRFGLPWLIGFEHGNTD